MPKHRSLKREIKAKSNGHELSEKYCGEGTGSIPSTDTHKAEPMLEKKEYEAEAGAVPNAHLCNTMWDCEKI
jgi:hypothetical protein